MQSRCKVIQVGFSMTTELFFSIASYQMPQGDRQIHRAELLGAISAWYGNVDRKAPMSAALRSRLVTLVIHSDTWHICVWMATSDSPSFSPSFCSTTPGYRLALFAQRGFGQKHPGHAILRWPLRRNWGKSMKFRRTTSWNLRAFSTHRPSTWNIYIHIITYIYTSYYAYCVYTMLTVHNFTTDMIHWVTSPMDPGSRLCRCHGPRTKCIWCLSWASP